MASPGPRSLYLPHLLDRSQPLSPPGKSPVTSYGEEAEGSARYAERGDLSYVEPPAQDDQPLDLTVTSRPRAGSSGGSPHGSGGSSSCSAQDRALSGGSLTYPQLPPSPPQRLITLPAVCHHQAGCGCASPSPGPYRSHSHHAAHYGGHRHSPYPLQYSPPWDGQRHLCLPGGLEVGYAPPSPRGALLPLEQRGSVSPPEYAEVLRRSPLGPAGYPRETALSPYASEALLQPGASSPSAHHHLYPAQLPHSTASPPSLSPRPWGGDQDGSPRPSSTGQASSPGRSRDVSPRPLYRPFEESRGTISSNGSKGVILGMGAESTSFSQLSSSVSSSFNVLDRGHPPTDDDLTASSSLLLLSLQPQSQSQSQPGRSDPLQVFKRESEDEDEVDRPSQSDGERLHYHQLVSVSRPSQPSLLSRGDYQASSKPEDWIPAESSRLRSDRREVAGVRLTTCGPAQDHTVASSSPTLYPERHPRDSPHPLHSSEQAGHVHSYHGVTSSSSSCSKSSLVPHMQQRMPRRPSLKVVGSSPLVLMREKRAQQQLKQLKENVRNLIASRSGHLFAQQRDKISGEAAAAEEEVREGGEAALEEEGSTGHASPGAASSSSTSSSSSSSPSPRPSDDRGLDRDFPIPPDPHLKMSALDYLISEVLVKRIDVPFKPYNKEVNDIFTGVKKGRLTLVDLIELRVEASLKAS